MDIAFPAYASVKAPPDPIIPNLDGSAPSTVTGGAIKLHQAFKREKDAAEKHHGKAEEIGKRHGFKYFAHGNRNQKPHEGEDHCR